MIGNGFPGTSGQSLPDSSIPSAILPNAKVGQTVNIDMNVPGSSSAPIGTGEIIYNELYCIIKFTVNSTVASGVTKRVWCGNGTNTDIFGQVFGQDGSTIGLVHAGINGDVLRSYITLDNSFALNTGVTYYIVCPTILYVYSR